MPHRRHATTRVLKKVHLLPTWYGHVDVGSAAASLRLARARVSLRGHPNFFRIFRTEGTQVLMKIVAPLTDVYDGYKNICEKLFTARPSEVG